MPAKVVTVPEVPSICTASVRPRADAVALGKIRHVAADVSHHALDKLGRHLATAVVLAEIVTTPSG